MRMVRSAAGVVLAGFALVGSYFQALQKQTFDVSFVRR
jgi:hypothetical protein